MILEDDIHFVDGAKERLRTALANIPSNWDMLYLSIIEITQGDTIFEDIGRDMG